MRALERFTERMIERQRALYASDEPFVEKWRTAMRFLVAEDVTYEKVWMELQAMAWNDEGLRDRLARVNAEWRSVLTDAFREPHRELGIDMPLEALVSLVITFNIGIMVERLGGIEAGHAGAPGLDRRMAVELTARAREQTARPLPGRVGYVERDGVRVFYEVYGIGRADVPAAADVVDHPLAAVEGADPVPRARAPRRHLRRPRQRALRPPGRCPRHTTSASSRWTRLPCSTRPRPTAPSSSATRSARRAG